jgi:hypothetical protein
VELLRLCEAIKQSATSLAHGFNNCYLLSGSSLILLTSLIMFAEADGNLRSRFAEQRVACRG